MEEALSHIIKECHKTKHGSIQKACQEALDLLEDKSVSSAAQPHQLRARCLSALRLALESKTSRLSSLAISGMQLILKEERFQSCMESEEESHWLSMQMLHAIRNTASLPEDVQVEVMRLLLNMTMASTQCMNAPVIICIAKLCFDAIATASRHTLRNFIVNTFLRMLHLFTSNLDADSALSGMEEVMVESYSQNGQCSVRTAVKATFTQLLSTLTDKVVESDLEMSRLKGSAMEEFSSKGSAADAELLSNDVVAILQYLCDRLSLMPNAGHGNHGEPLLLEGILTVVCRLPESVSQNQQFRDLVWQKLCPSLISILANPLADKTVVMPQRSMSMGDEVGRGSGCSATAPSILSGSAKTIYGISVNLVRALGRYASLRPVLESLFHRMLLYPPPVHRLDAIKAIRPLLSTAGGLLLLAGPTVAESKNKPTGASASAKRKQENELRLLKLIVDSIQECCHCNDSAVAITSVELINQLLTSVEELVKGHGISTDQAEAIKTLYKDPEESSEVMSSLPPSTRPDDSDDSSDEDESDVEVLKQSGAVDATDSLERLCAKAFLEHLVRFLPTLCSASDVRKADVTIQEFSSNFCADVAANERGRGHVIVLNADAVYVTTYAVLHLSYNLFRSGYYDSEERSLPVSEYQFLNDIMDTGLLLILSRGWLSAVFHLIISQNIFQLAAADGRSLRDISTIPEVFVDLLTDIDGLSSKRIGGQLLSQFQKSTSKVADVLSHSSAEETTRPVSDEQFIEAGMMFSRKVLSVCWDGILDILSVLTSGKSSCGISGSLALLFNAKEESRKAREAICISLEGLQRAARLSSVLGLQDRCGAVFAQLATASCVLELEDIKRERHQHHQQQQQQQQQQQRPEWKPGLASVLAAAAAGATAAKPKLARLHAAHALSMDIILSIGLEIGSHTADCWQHVFRCCTHISELEHTYFSQGNDKITALLPRRQVKDTFLVDPAVDDDLETGDLYSPLTIPVEPVAPTVNVRELIHQSSVEAGWDSAIAGGGVLSASQASKVLCGLSQEVDRLYEDAANKLNMKSLVNFLAELCRCSHQQLAMIGRTGSGTEAPIPTNALLLFRLGDIMSRCVQSDRPLLHVMRTWNMVSQHLVEAACHRDRTISQRAIACIHEVVTTLLSSRNEPPHFHFNETLCKPFENLLCLELCDGDAQDQIVCSLCELVEACTSNIKSGWKPIFGALRAVKIQYTTIEEVNEARLRHVAAVLDVFNVFLGTDNVLVFANAAVDCILCLLKYVRGPGEFEEKDDSDSDYSDDTSAYGDNQDLCLPALQYLKQCSDFLVSMWLMPNCPVFVGANRIHTDHCHPIDPFVTNVDITDFRKPFLSSVVPVEHQSDMDNSGSQMKINNVVGNGEDGIQTNNKINQDNQSAEDNSSLGNQSLPDRSEIQTTEAASTVSLSAKDLLKKHSCAPSEQTVKELNSNRDPESTALEINASPNEVSRKNDHCQMQGEKMEDNTHQREKVEDNFYQGGKMEDNSHQREKVEDNSYQAEKMEDNSHQEEKMEDSSHQGEDNGKVEGATAVDEEVRNSETNEVEDKRQDFAYGEVDAEKKALCDDVREAQASCGQPKDGKSDDQRMSKHTNSNHIAAELLETVTRSLDELDNNSGALHVFFLIFEGLANAVSACPKNYQPQTLEVLFQLMRSAANTPGPRFALYIVNMLLLPTLQSWLRRGTSITGYWDAVTVANCKHYTGLCVDLVVEYIIQFSGQEELLSDVKLLLHQQLMVLVEFITEPVESLSRIGCSCIRHCLLHCGPVLLETMWEIAGSALQLAFDVTLFPLRQLMTPFHENSDNFYGDVGQVKVAIRLDSSPVECDRLRQLSHQVFLLDSQRSSSSHSSKVNSEDQKSFIFLIYKPEDSSDSVEAIRVPFRNLVIGLLSHQLLVQTIGTLLLRGTSNLVPSEVGMMASSSSDARSRMNSIIPEVEESQNFLRDSPLPGMLPYLSCRNLFRFLDCLSDSFRVALQFDSRPGLKFLIQKVLRTDVAANLYKQAGVSMTLYKHVLLEISARHESLCCKQIAEVLRDRIVSHGSLDGVKQLKLESNDSLVMTETKHQWALNELRCSTERVRPNSSRFLCMLRDAFDEACTQYLDLYLEREGPSIADRLSQSLLVFLLAEPEELPSLKREKSLMEMVAEKLRKQSAPVISTDGEPEARLRGSRDSLSSEADLPEMVMPHRHRASIEDRVYTVATDKTIKSLMTEYRKRKQARSMPKSAPKPSTDGTKSAPKSKPSTDGPKSFEEQNGRSRDDVEKQIEEQQKSSIMKDGEARLRSWVEMLCSILQLLHQLPDGEFHALQPVFFHSIAQLTANCKDSQLRQGLGQWTIRIGRLFEIIGPEE